MGSTRRIDKTFLYSFIAVSVALIGVLGALFIGNLYAQFARNAEAQKAHYIETQKLLIRNEVEKVVDYVAYMKSLTERRLEEEIRNRTDEAHAIAMNIYAENEGARPLSEIEKMVKDALRPIRFNNGRGYYFAARSDGVEELFADKPELEGQNLIEMRDPDGKRVIEDMIALTKSAGEGFYHYRWTKPGEEGKNFSKIAYVKRLEVFDWFIGTGEYLDDVEEDIKKEILARIAEIRFGDEGYIFVVYYDGVTLMNATQKDLIGKNLWEMTDPNGVKVIQEERRAVENPAGGFIHYVWNKPSESRPAPKISFMKGVPEWRWMVGAGVYVDEIDEAIQKRRETLAREVRNLILKIAAAFAVLILVTFLMARWISVRMKRSFDAFSSFFQCAATESTRIDVESLYYAEFKELASAANRMIEQRGNAEAALAQSERQKKEMEAALRQTQKMESIGTLAGGIAHDFNNILCPIVGMAELLTEDFPAGTPEHERADEIRRAGLRGSELVRQILAMSRRSEGKSIHLRLQTVLGETLRLLRSTIPSNIEIEQDIQEDCGGVNGDPSRLQQIVMNLMTNAYHAVEETGGRVRVELAETEVGGGGRRGTQLSPGRYAALTVSDTGCGIAPEILEKIFEPYFTTKPPGKGTGLGLAVVYGIVKEHGGEIRVTSEPGHGASFEVLLPVADAEPEREPAVAAAAGHPTGDERILLVDDEESLVRMEKLVLERLGYRVTSFTDSVAALSAFEADPGAFDLVVTDMTMPNLKGDQLAARISAVRPGTPIIVCTGDGRRIDREEAAELGIDEFLTKPMVIAELARAVRRVIDDSVKRRG